jgi:RNA polymerase sigma-70 factor (ECF subfamily)
MAPDPDAELMLAFQGGDASAFRKLFERYARAMVAFCHHFVRNAARAEELAQDVFLKVHASRDRYRPDARFKTWLYRIASNHCLNEVRGAALRRPPEGEPAELDRLAGSAPTPEQALEGAALERAVRAVLVRLPEKQRAAFVLCRLEGLSYEEIADILGSTIPAVKSLIHRATVTAAEALQKEGLA